MPAPATYMSSPLAGFVDLQPLAMVFLRSHNVKLRRGSSNNHRTASLATRPLTMVHVQDRLLAIWYSGSSCGHGV